MEGLLLLLVPLALAVMIFIGLAMFVDVALLGGDRIAEERERLTRLWRPPYAKGSELLSWARETGASMAGRLLSHRGEETSLTDISAELHEGAMRAMLPHASERDLRRRVGCPEGGQGTIGVTALEAIESAEYIRTRLPEKRRTEILRVAQETATHLQQADGWGDAPPPPCALQGGNGHCLAYRTRPLRCRALHAVEIARMLDGDSNGREQRGLDSLRATIVATGVEEGWVRALGEAGLDATVYELNSALAVALDIPDALERWSAGEGIFDDCFAGPASSLQKELTR